MLSGARVLVVEEEALIALEIQGQIEAAGAGGIVICNTAARAMEMRNRWPSFDLAIVEGKLGAAAVVELVAALEAAGVPVVITSADRATAALFNAAFVEKPFSDMELVAACEAALSRGSPHASA